MDGPQNEGYFKICGIRNQGRVMLSGVMEIMLNCTRSRLLGKLCKGGVLAVIGSSRMFHSMVGHKITRCVKKLVGRGDSGVGCGLGFSVGDVGNSRRSR